MTLDNMDVLMTHLPSLIEACFYEREDGKIMVLKFIDFVLANPELKAFVEAKLVEFPNLHYKTKLKILRDLLVQMFDAAAEKKEEIIFPMKTYYDYLASRTGLVYSLLNCHLRE